MTLSNLPAGVTDADIDRHMGAPECPRCNGCTHEDPEFEDVMDTDMGVYTVSGSCTDCGAAMTGKGRKREPEGGVEDITWEAADDCGHEPVDPAEQRADAEEARAEEERDDRMTMEAELQ